ncbi:MAG: type II secretion system protein GspL, partial [Steroidobacteraceae bacterium]
LLEDGDATLRVPGAALATMPVDALGAALDGGGEAPVNGLIIYAAPADWQRHARDVEPLRERFEGIKVQLLTGGALSLFAQQLPSATPINLLQGTYAPTSSFATGWRAWRVPAILAVCLLGLHIVGKAVELGTLKQAERGIDTSIDDAFRDAMPGEQNTVDAKRRMEQRLAALRGDGGALGLLPALGALAQARANVPGTTIGTLSYRDGALDLRMSAPSAESLDRLSQTLRAEGWQADLTSGNATDAGYEGRLQLRPRGTS